RSSRRASLGAVDQFDAAVLRPAAFATFVADRTLFAVADHAELAGRAAIGLQRGGNGTATALTKRHVVLAAAALVGIAFQAQARGRAVAQVLGVTGHRGLELRLQRILIQVEVDDAVAQAGIGVEVVR